MKEHLVRVNSVASSSDDVTNGGEAVELRVRGGRSGGFGGSSSNGMPSRSDDPSPAWLNGRVLIDRRLKPGDTLNKIALQYSVQVADLKRANNLVNETAVFALPAIKVPVSRFFADRVRAGEATPQELEDHFIDPVISYVYNNDNNAAIVPGTNTADFIASSDRTPLLAAIDDEDSDEAVRRARVDAILERTDATVAQVRDQLRGSPGLENGAFHFVDATSPDTTMRTADIWLLIAAVVFIFVVVPLLLTLLEEKSEAEAELRHHHADHAHVVPPH